MKSVLIVFFTICLSCNEPVYNNIEYSGDYYSMDKRVPNDTPLLRIRKINDEAYIVSLGGRNTSGIVHKGYLKGTFKKQGYEDVPFTFRLKDSVGIFETKNKEIKFVR